MAMDWAWTGRLVAGALVPGPHLKTTAVSMARYSPGSVAGTSAALSRKRKCAEQAGAGDEQQAARHTPKMR